MTSNRSSLIHRVIFKIDKLKRDHLPPIADLRAAIRLLLSPYRSLFADRHLERAMALMPLHPISVLSASDEWLLLRIHDFDFWWPREYSFQDLPWIFHEVFTPSHSNPHAYEYGPSNISPGDWVIDAGASEGFFTRYALQRGARVICIEPVPLLAQALIRTFKSEIAADNVRVVTGALGSSPGLLRLAIQATEVYAAHISQVGHVETPIVTLDEIARSEPNRRIGFVKMDIEGSEVDAIAGAHFLLARDRPTLSIAVYHDEHNAQVLRKAIARQHPYYVTTWRGVWTARSIVPRPFMLFAHPNH